MTPQEQDQYDAMLLKHAKDQSIALELLEAALAQIVQYKELLGRAADALEASWSNPEFGLRGPMGELVKELRKAGQ